MAEGNVAAHCPVIFLKHVTSRQLWCGDLYSLQCSFPGHKHLHQAI